MGISLRQVDSADRLPPPSRDVRPAPYQRQRVEPAVILFGGAFVLLLLVVAIPILWWIFGADIRDWMRYGDGRWVVRVLMGLGLVALAGRVLRSWRFVRVRDIPVSTRQLARVDAGLLLDKLLEPDNTYAGAVVPAQYTYSPTYQARNDVKALEAVEPEQLPPADPFQAALDKLPRMIDMEHIADGQPSSFAVPLGMDQNGTLRWRDMRKDMLHVGIFGSSGAGKDNLLESWFVALTRQNEPSRLQFAVLDGKGHWTTPTLARRAHMWIAPAGGIGDAGQAALQAALKQIQTEAARRGRLVFGADCDTMERYVQKTGDQMPYLVVFISDVMGNIVGDVDRLLVDLVSKARALGIRVVVSMQTPTKQNTQWRANLSTVLSGQLQGRSQDAPAMGLNESDLLFPPSRLPEPKERPGVFSVRSGREQFLVQVPHVRRDYFAQVVADLPERVALRRDAAPTMDDLLERIRARAATMSDAQREALARDLARRGWRTRQMQYASRLRNERVCEIQREVQEALRKQAGASG